MRFKGFSSQVNVYFVRNVNVGNMWFTCICVHQCVKSCTVAFFFLLFVNLVFPILPWFATYRIHGLIDYVLGRVFWDNTICAFWDE